MTHPTKTRRPSSEVGGAHPASLLGVLLSTLGPEDARGVEARLALTRRQAHVAEHARRLASGPAPVGDALPEAPEALEAAAAAAPDPGVRRALARRLRSGPGADLLTGADLLAAGMSQGPEVGRLLRALRAAARAGTVRSRRGAMAWLERERAS